MSFSLNKLKQLLPTKTLYENTPQAVTVEKTDSDTKTSNGSGRVEPMVGFRLSIDPGKASGPKEKDRLPEFQVHLIGARHLTTSFGLKSVQGYMVKVKLFPGSVKFDSEIKTTSWPKFDQVFKFSLEPSHKSSFKRKKDPSPVIESPPEKFLKGNFIVFTVFALLELPPSASNALKKTYSSFNSLLKQRPSFLKFQVASAEAEAPKTVEDKSDKAKLTSLTPSESERNLGSVTWFIDPKAFIECAKTGHYSTEEMWLPVKELAVRHSAESRVSVQSSIKGQIELTLELCECEPEVPMTPIQSNPFEEPEATTTDGQGSKNRFSLKKNVKIFMMNKNKKSDIKGLCLKVTTSRMRSSIKAKECFEKITSESMYIKTSIFQSELFMKAWKSDSFAPTLSLRWNPTESTVVVPLQSEDDLKYTNVRVSVATKNKVGKKIVFGEINLGPTSDGSLLEHWGSMISARGNPVTMWHNFK